MAPTDPLPAATGGILIRRFALRWLVFVAPLLLVVTLLVASDPLKVFRSDASYYGPKDFLDINREMVCLKTFESKSKDFRYDSFIFGSSRSISYHAEVWQEMLPEGSKAFHFDALGETTWGVRNKIRYLQKKNTPLRQVLLSLDEELLAGTGDRTGYLIISPPALSLAPPTRFYKTSLQALLQPRMAASWIDYSLFRTKRPYMGLVIRDPGSTLRMNPLTADLHHGVEAAILKNPDSYYTGWTERYGTRERNGWASTPVTEARVALLREISTRLEKSHTSVKIIVNPVYNQQPISDEWLKILRTIFGETNVFDYSGKNSFTDDFRNYYDASHFRPHVGTAILEEIYD
jgi:hypothetical protein